MSIFKKTKRSVQVSIVKTPQSEDSASEEKPFIDPDTVKLIAERTREVVKYAALTAIGVYAAIKTIDTASQIAVKKTKSADNQN